MFCRQISFTPAKSEGEDDGGSTGSNKKPRVES
jgi:hypothetical protein